jgi:hypothetical protein
MLATTISGAYTTIISTLAYLCNHITVFQLRFRPSVAQPERGAEDGLCASFSAK